MNTKDARRIEQVTKSIANHRRIYTLYLLNQQPEQSVHDLAERIRVNVRTASDHLQTLMKAGLVMKRHDGTFVLHALTEKGKQMLSFIEKI